MLETTLPETDTDTTANPVVWERRFTRRIIIGILQVTDAEEYEALRRRYPEIYPGDEPTEGKPIDECHIIWVHTSLKELEGDWNGVQRPSLILVGGDDVHHLPKRTDGILYVQVVKGELLPAGPTATQEGEFILPEA